MPGRPIRYDTAKADMMWQLVLPGLLLLGYDTIPGLPIRYDAAAGSHSYQGDCSDTFQKYSVPV